VDLTWAATANLDAVKRLIVGGQERGAVPRKTYHISLPAGLGLNAVMMCARLWVIKESSVKSLGRSVVVEDLDVIDV
jgi:hypothetical protein